MSYKTEQEEFWAGEFGTQYIQRNKSKSLLASNLNFFGNILKNVSEISNCLEFGANIGMNLQALSLLFPEMRLGAVEINQEACNVLRSDFPEAQVYNGSILDFQIKEKWDLVLIKGVLIHINPSLLEEVYNKLHKATDKYILIAEYYNRTPTEVEYRGFSERLFKRDFCGEIMDKFSDLKLIDYGFCYHRDNNFPQDDISWFLLKKDK